MGRYMEDKNPINGKRRYYIDTNVVIRYLLHDNEKHYREAQYYFTEAKSGSIILIMIPEIIHEIEYVLRKVYAFPRPQVSEFLEEIISTRYITIKDSLLLQQSIAVYRETAVDLADIFSYFKAKHDYATVLSFDKTDFRKIERYAKKH